MCIGTSVHADIRVSVQDRSAPDRVSGHLAAGILVDADAVLVPRPSPELLDPSRDLEIVVFPTDLAEHTPVDVLTGWKWSRFALRGQEKQPTAAVAKLAHHATYGAQIGEVDSGELARLTAELDGDLWAALTRLEAVPPGIGEIDPALLARLGEVERAQRVPRRAEHTFDSYEAMTDGFCIFFCFCHPHHPRSKP
ncbi:hypothetical protein [Catellatospora paridis]|uniref:hypothetical protein n=1 Tax=Catellatospora paridis TaxID=1617086 RepID=UPI0012D433B4|nr:hypothetical protein [Catellatospora paridis]